MSAVHLPNGSQPIEDKHTCYHPLRAVKKATLLEIRRAHPERPRPPPSPRHRATRALMIALCLCFGFMILEFFGGIYGHSLALLTDAAHLLTDVGALSVALLSVRLASRKSTSKYTYGWHRAEVVGALISVLTIWALVALILIESAQRMYRFGKCRRSIGRKLSFATDLNDTYFWNPFQESTPESHQEVSYSKDYCTEVDARMMTILGIVGLLVNISVALILHFASRERKTSCTSSLVPYSEDFNTLSEPQVEASVGSSSPQQGEAQLNDESNSKSSATKEIFAQEPLLNSQPAHVNLNIRGAFLHALGDCLQSIGVILAGMSIWIGGIGPCSKYNIADPLSSLVFAAATLYSTKNLFRDLWGILLESCPPSVSYADVYDDLLNLPHVRQVDDMHLWSLSNEHKCATVRLIIDSQAGEGRGRYSRAVQDAKQIFISYGITHSTVEIMLVDFIADPAVNYGTELLT